jgi:hypothetical protein
MADGNGYNIRRPRFEILCLAETEPKITVPFLKRVHANTPWQGDCGAASGEAIAKLAVLRSAEEHNPELRLRLAEEEARAAL